MSKTIIVAGFGPGISSAVASRFGRGGFTVALVGRSEDKLAAGVRELEAQGVRASAFPTDLSDPDAVRALVGKVRAALGPITAIHWNAYTTSAGDLLTADTASLRSALDLAVTSLVAAVQEALPDLRKNKESAVLVTNGGFGYFHPEIDAAVVAYSTMGLAIGNSAKHKLVSLLAQKLRPEGVYVGEVVVTGTVKGTAFDHGSATLDPASIADKFWELYSTRKEVSVDI